MLIEKKIRVANVVEEAKIGGPQIRMVRVASALANEVETIICMPQENSEEFCALCDRDGVSYQTLPLTRITKEWRAALAFVVFSPWEVLQLALLFRRKQIDLVHASGGSWQYKAVIAAWLVNIPVVWHLNDTFTPGWVRWLFGRIQSLANGFIFASKRSQDYYGSLISAGRQQTVVPSTVDLNHFNPSFEFPLDPELPVDNTSFVIGTVANVNPIKGIETLIRAAVCLQNHGYKLHVVIVGLVPKSQQGYLRKLLILAEDLGFSSIQFIGAREDVRPIVATFDVYICSSNAESSPVAVWEAMSMARAIVSTDVGDVSRYIENGVSGFVVPVSDHKAMAVKIELLLKDLELRTTMGTNARKAADFFNPEKIAELTLGAYHKAILDQASI